MRAGLSPVGLWRSKGGPRTIRLSWISPSVFTTRRSAPSHPGLFHDNNENNNFDNSQHFLMLAIVLSALYVLIHSILANAINL